MPREGLLVDVNAGNMRVGYTASREGSAPLTDGLATDRAPNHLPAKHHCPLWIALYPARRRCRVRPGQGQLPRPSQGKAWAKRFSEAAGASWAWENSRMA